jgi:exo-beta-1,3-glucanase (GH17 family)
MPYTSSGKLIAHSIPSELMRIVTLFNQWNTLANDAKSQGFGAIRIEGFECNALDMVSSAAAAVGIQVMAGISVQV